MIKKINDIINYNIIRIYHIFRFYTVWSIVIGVLFLKAPSFMRAAAIVNIICCSISGIVIMALYGTKIAEHYHFTKNEARIYDMVLHVMIPSVIVSWLLINFKTYKLQHAVLLSGFIALFYVVSMDFNEIYAFVPNMHYFVFSFVILLLLLHVLLNKFSTKFSL